MSWLETLPALLVALAIVLIPGASLAWYLGLRSTSLLGLAPVLSLSMTAVRLPSTLPIGVPVALTR